MIYDDGDVFTEVSDWLKGTLPDSLIIKQSSNSYSYTVNNPLRYIDPAGTICEACGGNSGGVPKWTIDTAKTAVANRLG